MNRLFSKIVILPVSPISSSVSTPPRTFVAAAGMSSGSTPAPAAPAQPVSPPSGGIPTRLLPMGQLGLMGYDPAASLRQQMAGLREQLVIRTRVSPYEIPSRFVPGIPVPGIAPAAQLLDPLLLERKEYAKILPRRPYYTSPLVGPGLIPVPGLSKVLRH